MAILSIGHIGNNVTQAIDRLKQEIPQLSVAHYDMRYLKPIDTDILNEVGRKYKHVITIEDGARSGGLGSAVLEYFADNNFTPQVIRLGLPTDKFVEHGTIAELQHLVKIDADAVVEAVKRIKNMAS